MKSGLFLSSLIGLGLMAGLGWCHLEYARYFIVVLVLLSVLATVTAPVCDDSLLMEVRHDLLKYGKLQNKTKVKIVADE